MSQARALSSDEVQQLRDELAQGNSPTVWFTAEAVGVPEGRSGKVTALGEPAEGDFVQVRPAGSKDVLSFSASEVTFVKPPRKRRTAAEAAPAKKEQPTGAASSARTSTSTKQDGSGQPQPAGAQQAAKQQKSTGHTSSRPASTNGTRRKQPQISGATVTLSADQEGQWHVEVNTGKKRALKPTQVTPSAVAQAAKVLHDDVADAVEPLLEAARERQRTRVEELQRELAEAQRALDEMTD